MIHIRIKITGSGCRISGSRCQDPDPNVISGSRCPDPDIRFTGSRSPDQIAGSFLKYMFVRVMVVKTDGYSETGAHMYILPAQIYISRKFEIISKRHTLRSAQHVLSYYLMGHSTLNVEPKYLTSPIFLKFCGQLPLVIKWFF